MPRLGMKEEIISLEINRMRWTVIIDVLVTNAAQQSDSTESIVPIMANNDFWGGINDQSV